MEWSSYLLNDKEKFCSYQAPIRNEERPPSSLKLSVTALQCHSITIVHLLDA